MALLEEFNNNDVSPMLTRDSVLSGLKSKPKSYTKKEAEQVFGEDELTEEDIQALREEAEAKLALKRGLIELSDFNKTITKNKDKLKHARTRSKPKGLASVSKTASKPKLISKEIQDIIDSVKPQTLVKGKSVQPTGKRSSLKNAPSVSQKQESFEDINFDTEEKFEVNFLFSTKGVLNGDVLLDILIETWDYHNKRRTDFDEDEEKSGLISSLTKTILKYSGLLALYKGAKKVLAKAFNSFKGKIKNALSGLKNAFKAMFVDPVVNAFKKLKNKLLGWLEEGKALFKKAGEKVAKGVKNVIEGTKNVLKGAGKTIKNLLAAKEAVEQGAEKAIEAAAKKSGKTLLKEAAKETTQQAVKQGTKKASKSGLKAAVSKIPIIGTALDLGFMEMDIRDRMKENGSTREQAYDSYIDDLKNNFGGWDWIDPLKIAQKGAVELGVDKVGGWIGDKVGDAISWFSFGNETPAERMKKYQEELEKKTGKKIQPKQGASLQGIDQMAGNGAFDNEEFGIRNNSNETLSNKRIREESGKVKQSAANSDISPVQPSFMQNPIYRTREPQMTFIEKEQSQRQNMTPINNFEKDTNEAPLTGFSYLGAY